MLAFIGLTLIALALSLLYALMFLAGTLHFLIFHLYLGCHEFQVTLLLQAITLPINLLSTASCSFSNGL